MNDKNTFIARHQAGLSYLVIGSYFAIKIAQLFGFGAELDANDLKEIVMVVVLFWFMRERGTKPEDTVPPGATRRTSSTVETETEATGEPTASTTGEKP